MQCRLCNCPGLAYVVRPIRPGADLHLVGPGRWAANLLVLPSVYNMRW